jgi:acetolactate synthase-1/2/3 large subunit
MTVRTESEAGTRTGAGLLVDSLEAQGVKHVFGIPGAKIDKVFDTLVDSSIQTIVCRHEQNAAFIASGIGRMTGKAGVVLATYGPGVSDLATGLATATSGSDPLVAIGGAVPVARALKQVHQSMDRVGLMRPVTKFSVVLAGKVLSSPQLYRIAASSAEPSLGLASSFCHLQSPECLGETSRNP